MKTVQAHGHFVTCLAWGRRTTSQNSEGDGSAKTNGASNNDADKIVNVVASGSVDQTIKIWLP